jgi:uncharacterized protein YciI
MVTAREMMYTDVSLTSLTGEQLRARVARAQLYLLEMGRAAGVPSTSLTRDHLAYFYKLEMEGRLFGFGPLEGASAGPREELAIVAAASRAEAETIAANEPLRRAGLQTNRIRSHTMNEGVACYVGRALSRRIEALGESLAPGIEAVDLSYEALVEKAAGASLHLIFLEPTDKRRPAEDTQSGYDHFIWLRSNEMQAKLMSCGPLESLEPVGEGVWGGGLGVVATSREEAQRIADEEPSGRAGYRRLVVRPWTLDYGLAAPIGKALARLNSLP